MSDKLRNGLIRVALVTMFGCYYVGGLVADSRSSVEPSEFAATADLQFDLERRLNGFGDHAHVGDQRLCIDGRRPEDQVWLAEKATMVNLLDGELQRRNALALDDKFYLSLLDRERDHASKYPLKLSVAATTFQDSMITLRSEIYRKQFKRQHIEIASRCAGLALLANHCATDEICQPVTTDPNWQTLCDSLCVAIHELNQACHSGCQTKAAAALQRAEWVHDEWQVAVNGSK